MQTIPLAILVHASAAFLVLILGPVNLLRPRRDALHRWLGRSWVLLMYLTCASSFLFGLEDGFTALHGLSIFTTVSVTAGVWAITHGRRQMHVFNMAGSYLGTLIAFGFAAFVPSRLISRTAVADPVGLVVFALGLGVVAGVWVLVLRARVLRAGSVQEGAMPAGRLRGPRGRVRAER